MIHHIVVCTLRPDHDADELAAVMAGLAGLIGKVEGFMSFHHGPNRDYEGKSEAYAYGFNGIFTDPAAVARYASDPRHQTLGGRLVALCQGGGDGIMVIDLEVAE